MDYLDKLMDKTLPHTEKFMDWVTSYEWISNRQICILSLIAVSTLNPIAYYYFQYQFYGLEFGSLLYLISLFASGGLGVWCHIYCWT